MKIPTERETIEALRFTNRQLVARLALLQAVVDLEFGDPSDEWLRRYLAENEQDAADVLAEPDPDAAHDWDRDTRALDETRESGDG